MPTKKNSGEDGSPTGLTDGELRFIKAIFDNMTQKPDADWDAVAHTLSLKDAKCAKERFRQMSVRHGWRGDASAAASPRKSTSTAAGDKVTKKPRTPRKPAAKKSAKKAEAEEDEDDEDVKDEVKTEGKKVKNEDEDLDME
ncbi:hypothetical protein NW768_003631 [Fusarium equiseti]|uniref:Myb-like domain-containing protein n=1 Tax=Fusarium equiseti TaxID=61235 RepID=A0ABQ8RI66_FUSEQ|nr:hypothetical protein NW768_003631 [Fusarium equiseti]